MVQFVLPGKPSGMRIMKRGGRGDEGAQEGWEGPKAPVSRQHQCLVFILEPDQGSNSLCMPESSRLLMSN